MCLSVFDFKIPIFKRGLNEDNNILYKLTIIVQYIYHCDK